MWHGAADVTLFAKLLIYFKYTKFLQFGGQLCFLARALRFIFPEKPFNPALTRITACNQTGCECMVCTSNPSLMQGLSCPEIDLYICNVCAFQAQTFIYMYLFLAFFFEIFGYARQYEQALLHSLARKFGYARHSPNKFLKVQLLAMAKFE